MSYKRRFEALVHELSVTSGVRLKEATIGPPTDPQVIAAARKVAGAAWPDGMSDLYAELSYVDLEWHLSGSSQGGAIHIPSVTDVWDHAAHQDELWFDFVPEEGALRKIRPIDRFVAEAYAVIYPVPGDRPATVHYHYCGEELVPTGLSYKDWLELLLRSRGAMYWLQLTLGPSTSRTWVEENLDKVAAIFPSFKPETMIPSTPFEPIDLD